VIWRSGKYLKHAVPIVLLAVWVLHFIYPVFYSAELLKIRHSQREIIHETSTGDLAAITLPNSLFKEAYNPTEKELELDGTMYDVARLVRNGGSITCYVLKDKDETSLGKKISVELQHQQNVKRTSQAPFWWPVILLCSAGEHTYAQYLTSSLSFHDGYNATLREGHCNSCLHPPQMT
jgi:hypothetical protein